MKIRSFVSLMLLFSVAGFAGPSVKSMQLIDKKKAILIFADKDGVGQAAAFVDGSNNDEFIGLLLKADGATLNRLANDLKKDNDCGDGEDRLACGEVVVQGKVLNSFGRGGWSAAGASYRYLMGWRQSGTGHFFDAKYTFEIHEDVAALDPDPGSEAPRKFSKTLTFTGARDISKDALDIP